MVRRRAAASNRHALVQTAAGGSAENEFFFEMLAAQTLAAQASGSLLARKPEMDFLLRLAGTTQISKAIEAAGAVPGKGFILVVAGRSKPRQAPGLSVHELPRLKLSKAELQRVEKAAVLNALRAR